MNTTNGCPETQKATKNSFVKISNIKNVVKKTQ